ncbi:hypothetical protein FA13DRAFT_1748481, partial [Coprinellus micaceus]
GSTFNITTNAPNGTVYNGTFNSNTFHSGATGASQSAPVATGREHVKNGKSRSQSQGISEPVAQDQAFDHMGRYYPAPLNIDHTVRYAEDQRRHISAEDIDPYVDPSGYSTRPSPDSWEADPTHYAQGDYFTYRGNEHPQPFIAQGRWVPGEIHSSLRTFCRTDDTILIRKPGSCLGQAASPMPPQPQPYRNFTMPHPSLHLISRSLPTHAMPAPVHPQGKPRTWTTGDAGVPEHIYALRSYE